MPQLAPSNEQLDNVMEIFADVNVKVVKVNFVSCIDESTLEWTGGNLQEVDRKGPTLKKNKFITSISEDVPNVVVIPSKPHPVSILLHGDMFCFPHSTKPFCVRLVMRHSDNRVTFPEAMFQLIERSPNKENKHIG